MGTGQLCGLEVSVFVTAAGGRESMSGSGMLEKRLLAASYIRTESDHNPDE